MHVTLTGSNGVKAEVDPTGALKTTASFSGTIDSVSMKDKYETLIVRHTDFSGKVVGRIYDIPHITRGSNGSSLTPTPTEFAEATQSIYDQISTWDGVLRSGEIFAVGQYMRHVYNFDILTIAKRTPGKMSNLSITDLRNDMRQIVVPIVITGYGANGGVKTYGVKIKLWNKTTSTWDEVGSTAATSTTLVNVIVSGFSNYVTDDGFLHIFVHPTYPADGTLGTSISVDYVRVELTMIASFLNNDHVSTVEEQILNSATITAGATSSSWSNVDTSRCDEYAIAINPSASHTYSVASAAVGRDNVELDASTDRSTLIASATQGKKRSDRTKVPARKVNIYVTNGDVADRTYYGRFLRYGVKGGQFV